MEENTEGGAVSSVASVSRCWVRTESEDSESEPYLDCEDCSEEEAGDSAEDGEDGEEEAADSAEDGEEGDGLYCDRLDSLEFDYEPGISLSSLQFHHRACDCQQESESGDTSTCSLPPPLQVASMGDLLVIILH